MKNKTGYATYKRGKMYFDDIGWALLKKVARKTHKSPTTLVIGAIRRYCKARGSKCSL